MSATTFDTTDRNIIPRWRDSNLTATTKEGGSLGAVTPRPLDMRQLKEKRLEWEQHPSTITATELLNAAVVLNQATLARDAARYLLDAKTTVLETVKHLSYSILEQEPPAQLAFPPAITAKEQIRRLRLGLQRFPINPIAWVDLARAYATLGQLQRARQSMTVAVSLAPNNRFVLRSAARLYVHLDDPEQAHTILRRATATPLDPWLIAAELATANLAHATPLFVYQARQFLVGASVAPIHLSEMASALATLELRNGDVKKAKRLFRAALQDPTENTVAQINWATQQIGKVPMQQSVLEVPRLYEANAWGTFWAGRWQDALDNSRLWLDDQPFSSRPAVHGSYIAMTLLEDYASAEAFLREGLIANPRDSNLLNNLTVALAKTGKPGEAQRCFGAINTTALNEQQRIVWHATKGLLLFRNGDHSQGRGLYQEAITTAEQQRLESVGVQASIALATEEVLARTPQASLARAVALAMSRRAPGPVIDALARRLASLEATPQQNP